MTEVSGWETRGRGPFAGLETIVPPHTAGPSAAANATCTATGVDSTAAAVPVTVGACVASSGTAASLPAGATLTCAVRAT